MRGASSFLLVMGIAACSPEIAPGTYVCGPERGCPDGQACNGADNTCVLPGAVQPFECGDVTEAEPNDTRASAEVVLPGNAACVTPLVEVVGCTLDADREDWFELAVPAACTASAIEAQLAYTIAYEALTLEVRDAAGATLAAAAPCPQQDPDDATERSCLETVVTAGEAYALRVAGSGDGDCAGACAHNRYTLTVQLTTR